MEIFILGRIKNSAPLNEAEPNERTLDLIEANQERHTKLWQFVRSDELEGGKSLTNLQNVFWE